MPEHLRALVVILAISIPAFIYLERMFPNVDRRDFVRRRNLWFALTLAAFLTHNIWLYALAAGLLILFAASKESNQVALFFSILMVVPSIDVQIPGMGLINYLFAVNHVRLLELAILLPVFLRLQHDPDTPRLGRLVTDKLLIAYLLLVLMLAFRHTSVTDVLRQLFYLFIDIVLPYFVISRTLRKPEDFRAAMAAFVVAAALVAFVSIFEAVRHWHLYRAVTSALGIPMDSLSIVQRSGLLRAMGPTGHPIVTGYILTVAIGFFLYLGNGLASPTYQRIGYLVLVLGLLAPMSRGPWMGALALVLIFIAMGPRALINLTQFAFAGTLALIILTFLPGGQKVIDVMPVIGTADQGSINYRQQVYDNSMIVIMRNPLFGSIDYAFTPEIQSLKQGMGIIDIVNSYLILALQSGLIGLGMFLSVFVTAMWVAFRGLRSIPDKTSDMHRLGRSLLATLGAAMIIIVTVSPISLIPIAYWSLAGMCVAYSRMARERTLHSASWSTPSVIR